MSMILPLVVLAVGVVGLILLLLVSQLLRQGTARKTGEPPSHDLPHDHGGSSPDDPSEGGSGGGDGGGDGGGGGGSDGGGDGGGGGD